MPSQHHRQQHGGCWELQQSQGVMIRDSWFVTSHQRLLWQGWFISPVSNGTGTRTEQCENPCEGQASHKHLQGACLPWVSFYLFKSLCPMVPFIVTWNWAQKITLRKSIPQKWILFQSSAVTGSGVIFLFCLLLFAASISASLKIARARFCLLFAFRSEEWLCSILYMKTA